MDVSVHTAGTLNGANNGELLVDAVIPPSHSPIVKETRISLRILMDRHKFAYRAVNDTISFLRLNPDMTTVRSVNDVLQHSSNLDIKQARVCCHCHFEADNDTCSEDCR